MSILSWAVAALSYGVIVNQQTCFDLDLGTAVTGAPSSSDPSCAGTEMHFSIGVPDPYLIVMSPSGNRTLCVWLGTGMGLANMPDVLPQNSDCSNGLTSPGWARKLTGGSTRLQNVGIYVKDEGDASKAWKVWAVLLGTSSETSEILYKALPAATNAPATPAPATPAPATATPTNAPDTPAPASKDTTAPNTPAPDTPAPATPNPGSGPAIGPTPAPATPEPPPPPIKLCADASWSSITLNFLKDDEDITVTATGPSDTWFAFGFGARMQDSWTVTVSPTTIQEYVLGDQDRGELVDTTGWSEQRTAQQVQIQKTIPMNGPNHSFPLANSFPLIMACGGCAVGEVSNVVSYHRVDNRWTGTAVWALCTTDAPPTAVPTVAPQTPSPGNGGGVVTETEVVDEGSSSSSSLMIILIIVGASLLLLIGLIALVCLKCCHKTGPTQKKKTNKPEIEALEEPMLEVATETEGSGEDDVQGLTPRNEEDVAMETETEDNDVKLETTAALSELDVFSDDDAHRESYLPEDDVAMPEMVSQGPENPINYYEDPELQQLRHRVKENNITLAVNKHANDSLNFKFDTLTKAVVDKRTKKSLPLPPSFAPAPLDAAPPIPDPVPTPASLPTPLPTATATPPPHPVIDVNDL